MIKSYGAARQKAKAYQENAVESLQHLDKQVDTAFNNADKKVAKERKKIEEEVRDKQRVVERKQSVIDGARKAYQSAKDSAKAAYGAAGDLHNLAYKKLKDAQNYRTKNQTARRLPGEFTSREGFKLKKNKRLKGVDDLSKYKAMTMTAKPVALPDTNNVTNSKGNKETGNKILKSLQSGRVNEGL